jgi:hypothetical protein
MVVKKILGEVTADRADAQWFMGLRSNYFCIAEARMKAE